MSDLISRDEALRVLEELRREMSGKAYDAEQADDFVTMIVAGNESEGLTKGIAAIRALPAATDERRCETCAEWYERVGSRAICHSDAYQVSGCLVTKPDHSCAAWKDGAR